MPSVKAHTGQWAGSFMPVKASCQSGSRTQEMIAFHLPGDTLRVQQAAIRLSLPPPRTFSRCVGMALQLLRNQRRKVFFYMDDVIVIAKSREWAMFNTLQLSSPSTGGRVAPCHTNRLSMWGLCSQRADCGPLIRNTDAQPLLQGVGKLRHGVDV